MSYYQNALAHSSLRSGGNEYVAGLGAKSLDQLYPISFNLEGDTLTTAHSLETPGQIKFLSPFWNGLPCLMRGTSMRSRGSVEIAFKKPVTIGFWYI